MAVKVFGADWCAMTAETKEHLDERGVAYDYVDIDVDRKAAAWVREQNGGKESKPTVDVGGIILTEPTNEELDAALEKQRLAG